MTYHDPSDEQLRELLTAARRVAVVGASSDPMRPSHGIFKQLLRVGYEVIPVNPNESSVLGQQAYAKLADVPGPIDIVVVFRRAEHTPGIADEAVAAGARALWLQSGIINEDAQERALRAGLFFVMDACIGVMLSRLRIPTREAQSG